MRKILSISLLAVGTAVVAQEKTSVEKSVTGVQIGFFGAEIYNEAKLSDQVSLRSQLSFLPSI